MFYFHHREQVPKNESYYKGLLFEDILRDYLSASGYSVNLTRAKHSSLEYDLEGAHEIDKHEVVGEAKAHQSTISGASLSSFVGKLVPLHSANKNLTGIFLSLSALTPDATDYLNSLAKSEIRVIAICGSNLEESVREKLRLPSEGQATAVVRSGLAKVLSQHIVHTDHGTYLACIGCEPGGAFPDRFALVDGLGDLVTDVSFLTCIRESVKAFQELEPFSGPATALPTGARREIPKGLITSTAWTDFRRPANPSFFIGRDHALAKATTLVSRSGSGCLLEVKARSGVGKSSLLALLADRWTA